MHKKIEKLLYILLILQQRRYLWLNIHTFFLLQGGQNEKAVDTILTATDRLFSSMGDAPEMVKQARILAQVSFITGVTRKS